MQHSCASACCKSSISLSLHQMTKAQTPVLMASSGLQFGFEEEVASLAGQAQWRGPRAQRQSASSTSARRSRGRQQPAFASISMSASPAAVQTAPGKSAALHRVMPVAMQNAESRHMCQCRVLCMMTPCHAPSPCAPHSLCTSATLHDRIRVGKQGASSAQQCTGMEGGGGQPRGRRCVRLRR